MLTFTTQQNVPGVVMVKIHGNIHNTAEHPRTPESSRLNYTAISILTSELQSWKDYP